MYSNDKGFNLIDILLKIVFFIIFIFVLIYLFPQVSDLNPFYNNIFRENLHYMTESAESYFNNNLPLEIGDTKKITLKEMIDKNLIIPFVDKENNSCNLYQSYAEIIKLKEGYKLKVNLVCNDESDFIEKTLGCNNYCDGVNCKNLEDACKNCEEKPAPTPTPTPTPAPSTCTKTNNITYYEFEKIDTVLSTSWHCEEGYSLEGNSNVCYRKVVNQQPSIPVYSKDKTITSNPIVIAGKTYRDYVDAIVTYDIVTKEVVNKIEVAPDKEYVPGKTSQSCSESCSITYEERSYQCNCKNTTVGGKTKTVCSICTESVPVKSCSTSCHDTSTPGYYISKCSNGYTLDKVTDTCYKYETTYKEEKIKNVNCPSGVDGSEGNPNSSNFKCYYIKTTPGSSKCEDPKATLVNGLCYTIIKGTYQGNKCEKGSLTADGKYCVTESTETKDAVSTTTSSTQVYTEWSTSPFLEGWRRTGKIRVETEIVYVPCK